MAQPATIVVNVSDAQALKALDGLARKFSDVGRKIQTVGLQLAGVGTAISAPLGLAVKTFADTDDALRAVGVISGSTEREMAKLRETAKSFATFAPRDVAEEMLRLAQAGLTAKESMEAVAQSLALQRIDPEIGNNASKVITGIAVPFNKAASEYSHIADILAIASARSTTSVGDLGIAMGYAANQGELAGLSIEQAAAAMAILADNGIDASRAGTNLRGILSTLVAKQKKFEKLGVKILDDKGEVREIEAIFRDLNKALSGLGGGEKLAVLVDTFGKLYSGGAAGLLKDAERFDALVSEMESSEGAAIKWAEAMDAGAGGALRSLKKDVAALAESVGKQLQGPLLAASERFKAFSTSMQGVIDANPKIVQGTAAVGASLLGVGTALIGVGYGYQFLGGAINLTSEAMATMLAVSRAAAAVHAVQTVAATAAAAAYSVLAAASTAAAVGPVAFIAIGVAAGVALVALEAFAAFRFGTDFAKQSGAMQILLSGLRMGLEALGAAFRSVSAVATYAFNAASKAAMAIGSSIAAALNPARLVRAVAGLARQIVAPFVNAFRGVVGAVSAFALRAFDSVANALSAGLTVVVEGIAQVLGNIAEAFAPLVQAARDAASIVFGPLVAAFRIFGREVAAVVGGSINFLGGLASTGLRIASQLGAAFAGIFREVAPSIQLVVQSLREGNFQQAFDRAAGGAKFAFLQGFDAIRMAWNDFVGYFAQAFDQAIQATLGRLKQAAGEMAKALKPAVFAFTLLTTGGDVGKATQAVDNMMASTKAAMDSIAAVQRQIGIESKKAQAAVRSDNRGILAQMEERTAAFNRDRGSEMLKGFLDDITTGTKGFGEAMRQAVAPLGGIMEGFGYDLGGTIAAAAEEAESLFTSQVFSGSMKQVIDQNQDAIGNQSLDVAKKSLEELKGIKEGVEDLELGWG